MEVAQEAKQTGNSLFGKALYEESLAKYEEGLTALNNVSRVSGTKEEIELKTTLLCNKAASCLKLLEGGDSNKNLVSQCVESCDEALDLSGDNVKALYRKAQVLGTYRKDINGAARCLKLLLNMEQNNKAALDLMRKLQKVTIEKESTIGQAMEVMNSIKDLSPEKAKHELRKVLGSIIDDPMLAKSMSQQGTCQMLWELYLEKGIDFSLIVLNKFADCEGCAHQVLASIDLKHLEEISSNDKSGVTDESRGAALQMIVRLAMNESVDFKSALKLSETSEEVFVLSVCAKALRAKTEPVRRAAIESIIKYCGENKERSKTFIETCKGLEALMTMITPEKYANASGVGNLGSASKDTQNFKDSIQQVALVLGRLLPSMKNDDVIKEHALAFCTPALKSTDVFDQILGAAALLAICIANKELGVALVEDEKTMELVNELARSAPARTQALICEIYSYVANTEQGRTILSGDAKVILQVLVQSETSDVRSAAAVALAKLNAIDFKVESNEGAIVLHSTLGLLSPDASKEEHAKGIEAISYVITDKDVKMMLCQSEGLQVLQELVKLSTQDNTAKEPFAYGLAYIFENLTISEDDKRREKLREMEVTEEQWEQFEKLTKSQSRKGKPDPPADVEFRIKAFIHADGAAALRALVLNGGSERVRQAIARTFVNVANVQSARGQLFKQGSAKALIQLATEGEDEKPKASAAHALGKMLITTDPHLLGHNIIMDSIAPLVKQVRFSDSDLVIFECSMALTNLSVLNEETKRKIINCKAIKAFEYASYSENHLVRRAAVEAINNLIPEKEVIDWFLVPQHMKIWLLFASDYEEDMETSRAATGALANLCATKEIAKVIEDQEEGLATLIVLLACEIPEIVHRVAYCIAQLLTTLDDGKKKLEAFKARDYLEKAKNTPGPAGETIKEILSTW